MCALQPMPPLGLRRVKRSRARYERVNRFAADRMVSAQTRPALSFWSRVHSATFVTEEMWERDEAFYAAWRRAHRLDP